jgi:hypothetical protein
MHLNESTTSSRGNCSSPALVTKININCDVFETGKEFHIFLYEEKILIPWRRITNEVSCLVLFVSFVPFVSFVRTLP